MNNVARSKNMKSIRDDITVSYVDTVPVLNEISRIIISVKNLAKLASKNPQKSTKPGFFYLG
jgi:hypothetical protein